MSPTLTPTDIAQLTPAQKLDLIELLWDSLEQQDIPVTEPQQQELDRRLETYEADKAEAVPLSQLKADIEKQLR